MMNIAQKYVDGLKKAYYENGGKKQWDHLENIMDGASQEDIKKLRALYPDIPNSLLRLLEIVDGCSSTRNLRKPDKITEKK